MRRIILATLSAIFAILMGATAALADSANFHFANASVSSSTGSLSVNFKETGLGTTGSEHITVAADSSATYQCWNNGGHHPKAGNKETVTAPVSNTGTFPVRNGQTTGTITAGPPGPGTFACPSGQNLFLVAVSYSGITISGQAGTISTTPSSLALSGLFIPIS